jgi:cellulose synthase operon protein C
VFLVLRPGPPPPPTFALAGDRVLEVRLAWAPAAAHRPYQVLRSSNRPTEDVPISVLAEYERKGDAHALGVADVLKGDYDRAKQKLLAAPASIQRDSDLAALEVLRGDNEAALTWLDAVLERAPTHPQALWNRALVLRNLGLSHGAAKAFRQVEALHEPGWATEAAQRAAALELNLKASREAWQAAVDALAALVLDHTPIDVAVAMKAPMQARNAFYLASWNSMTAAELNALRPLATALDELDGDSKLVTFLDQLLTHDLKRRAVGVRVMRPMIEGYYASWGSRLDFAPKLTRPVADFDWEHGGERVLAGVHQSAEKDLIAGALAMLGGVRSPEFEPIARAFGDPQLLSNVAIERFEAAFERGDTPTAEAIAREGLAVCKVPALQRCVSLRLYVGHLFKEQLRTVEAREQARAALEYASTYNEPLLQREAWTQLGDLARMRGELSSTRGWLEEAVLAYPKDAAAENYLLVTLASLRVLELDEPKARALLEQAAQRGKFERVGAVLISDVIRMNRKPKDLEWLDQVLGQLRADNPTEPEKLYFDFIAARARLDLDPVGARAALRQVIAKAQTLNGLAKRTMHQSYCDLRIDAGQHQEFEQLLDLLAEEGLASAKGRCVAAIEVRDDRTAIAVRGPTGVVSGAYRQSTAKVPAAERIPPNLKQALRGCDAVKVFAGHPIVGEPGLLGPDLAFSYASGAVEPGPFVLGKHVVVHDVEAPPELNLPRLAAWADSAEAGVIDLTGPSATPKRVTEAMRDASLLEINAHGLSTGQGQADGALVVLSKDGAGHYALTANEIRKVPLTHAPIVLLGACRAAKVTPYVIEPFSLPQAFIAAGARAVIAAPVDLPDNEARAFFQDLLGVLKRGERAPVALQQVRQKYLLAHPDAQWAKELLVFE